MTPPSTIASITTSIAHGRFANNRILASAPIPLSSRSGYRQPGQEQKPYGSRRQDRRREGEPPESQIRRHPARHGRKRGGDRAHRELIGEGSLADGGRDGIRDIHDRGGDHRREHAAYYRPRCGQHREIRRERRDQARHRYPDEGEAHQPYSPEPIGEYAPHRLHQTVDEVVEARHDGDLFERDAEAGGDCDQHRRDRKAVEPAEKDCRPEQPQPPLEVRLSEDFHLTRRRGRSRDGRDLRLREDQRLEWADRSFFISYHPQSPIIGEPGSLRKQSAP
jgi:hypothetical protein